MPNERQVVNFATGSKKLTCRGNNDKWEGRYRKADGPAKDVIHLIADDSLSLKVADRLKTEIAPQELFVQCPSSVERYELIKWEPPAKATT